MQATPISRIICLLTLGLGISLGSPTAVAIPGGSGPALAVDAPVAAPAENTGQVAPSAATAAPQTDMSEAKPLQQPDDMAAAQPVRTPCLNYFVSESDLEPGSETDTCADPGAAQQRISVQFGRSFASRSGVLGRFDGLLVDYRLRGGITLNGIAGRPVIAGQDPADSGKQVFGLSATSGKFASDWDLNSYIVQQQDNRRTESRALGGALRYLRSTHSLLVSLDYDMMEQSLSSLMVSGAWKLQRATTLSATMDVRHSYMRTPQAGYLKETKAYTEGWKWALPMDRIKYLAGKPSTEVTTLGLGLSHTFSPRIKLSGDFAMLDVWQDTTASSNEYFYRLQLSGKDLVLSGDKNTLDLHHSVTASSRTSSASLKSKYPINRLWQVSPQLRTDYRDNESDHSIKWKTAPAVKMEYRRRKQYGIEFEAGGEWSGSRQAAENQVRSSYFLSLGYRADF